MEGEVVFDFLVLCTEEKIRARHRGPFRAETYKARNASLRRHKALRGGRLFAIGKETPIRLAAERSQFIGKGGVLAAKREGRVREGGELLNEEMTSRPKTKENRKTPVDLPYTCVQGRRETWTGNEKRA